MNSSILVFPTPRVFVGIIPIRSGRGIRRYSSRGSRIGGGTLVRGGRGGIIRGNRGSIIG
jgi:hypothetical protein